MILLENISFASNIQESFRLIFEEMKENLGCEYLLYSIESESKKCRQVFTTNSDWHNVYIKENLINDCMLLNFGKKYLADYKSPIIFPWSSLQPSDKSQKYVIDARRSFNVGPGISFGQEFLGYKEFIGICGNIDDHEFSKNVILKIESFRKFFRSLRTISLCSFAAQNKMPYHSLLDFMALQTRSSALKLNANLLMNKSLISYFKYISNIKMH